MTPSVGRSPSIGRSPARATGRIIRSLGHVSAGGGPHTKLHRLWLLQLRPDQVHDPQSQGPPPADTWDENRGGTNPRTTTLGINFATPAVIVNIPGGGLSSATAARVGGHQRRRPPRPRLVPPRPPFFRFSRFASTRIETVSSQVGTPFRRADSSSASGASAPRRPRASLSSSRFRAESR